MTLTSMRNYSEREGRSQTRRASLRIEPWGRRHAVQERRVVAVHVLARDGRRIDGNRRGNGQDAEHGEADRGFVATAIVGRPEGDEDRPYRANAEAQYGLTHVPVG